MKIAILGAGNVGQAVGARLVRSGHEVTLSFAREAQALADAAARIGAQAAEPAAAVEPAEAVLLATPWGVTLDLVRRLAPALDGKIVWDTTNCLKPDFSGLEIGLDTSAGEAVAAAAPGARVVKAIVPMAKWLAGGGAVINGRSPTVFVCGDDRDARAEVARLVAAIGVDAVEAGPLRNARYAEPFGMLLVQLAYVEGLGTGIGGALLREEPHRAA
jgi:hypothetical protein